MNEKKLLELAHEHFAEAEEANGEAREQFEEDLRIFDGSGIWPERLRQAREGDPKGARPCLNISDLGPRVHQVTNDFRQNRPAIKIRPVDDKADIGTAEVFNGLARHIEQQSDADIAYETGNFYQSVAGYGYFRMVEEYYEGARELLIKPVFNPLSVFMDPYAMDPVGSDARYCFIVEDIPRATFAREYPGVDTQGWEADVGGSPDGWVTDECVRVAEWFQIETKKQNRIKTAQGEMSEDDYWTRAKDSGEKPEVMGTYENKRTVCMWRKLVGTKILKEVELPLCYIPVFRMAGENYVVNGRRVFKGIVRDSRDAVRMVSYSFSSFVEAVSLQPKAPFVGAAGQFDGYEAEWAAANSDNLAYLEYNPVDLNGQPAPPPRREAPPLASQGLMQAIVLAKDALKDTSGMGAASLGQKGNETSGKAILARQREGDVSTFHLMDNAAKAVRHCGRVLVQWAPKVYDARMVARIIGEDGEAEHAYLDPTQPEAMRKVQGADGSIKTIYNLQVGRYDVIAAVGPSYSTRRVEMVETMNQLFQSQPGLVPIVGDIFLKNQDMPGAEQMAKRLKAMLPPQAAQADAEEDQQPIPPEAQAQMQQLQMQLEEGRSIVQELMQENDQLKAEKTAKDAEIQAKIYAENEATQRTKIQSLASITVAEMNNETKELIAGMQHALTQAQMVNEQQNQFIEKLMQMQQVEHSQSLDIANTQHSQGMDLRNADNAEQQQQFSQQQAMEQQAMAAEQAQQKPPAGG